MKIMKKINNLRDEVRSNPNGALAGNIREQSILAMFGGIKSAAWKNYMKNFSSNAKQLERLCGQDNTFMTDTDKYGPKVLAYIAGGGPCGGGTCLGMPADMFPAMRNHLDNGLSSVTGPN